MNYDEYCDLFGPPSPLFKSLLNYPDRWKTPSKTSRCSTLNPLSPWNRSNRWTPTSPLWIWPPRPSCSGRRWRLFWRSTAVRTSLRTSSAPPGATTSPPSTSPETCSLSTMNPNRPDASEFECAPKATTPSISFLTSSNAALKSTLWLTQREEETEDGGVTSSYLNYHFSTI
jgi:hypothetical protein